jgi:hypothetical protein
MFSISYSYLDKIRETKGVNEYYTTILQTEYYQEIAKEVLNSSTKETNDLIKLFANSNNNKLKSIDSQILKLNNSLQEELIEIADLFEKSNLELEDINNNLNDITDILGWGFNSIIEHQRVTNVLLSDISELLKIPDIEKERVHYIKEGLIQIENAFYDSDFYSYAIKSFRKCLQKKETDYFSYFQLGQIYLFSSIDFNFTEAKICFEKSCKFLRPEILKQTTINTRNHLNHLPSKEIFKPDSITELYSECCYFLGVTNMLLGLYNEAINSLEESLKYKENMKVRYQYLKACFLFGNNITSELTEFITTNPLYFTITKHDNDFINSKFIQILLDEIKEKELIEIKNNLEEIYKNKITSSRFDKRINEIIELSQGNYTSLTKAKDLLNRITEETFHKASHKIEDDFKFGEVKSNPFTVTGNLIHLIKIEKKFQEELILRNEIFPAKYKSYLNKIAVLKKKESKEAFKINRNKWLLSLIIFSIFTFLTYKAGLSAINFAKEGERYIDVKSYFFAYPLYFLIWISFGFYLSLVVIKKYIKKFILKKIELYKETAYYAMFIIAITVAITHCNIIINRDLSINPNDWFAYIEYILRLFILLIIYLIPAMIIAYFISLFLEKYN